MVSKAETEFFKIVEAEKKALEEAENKRNAALADVKQAIAQEGVTHEEYKEGEAEVKKSDEVTALFSPSYFPWGPIRFLFIVVIVILIVTVAISVNMIS